MKILAMSDLHGQLPKDVDRRGADLLLFAGDLCPDFRGIARSRESQQTRWLETTFLPWVERFKTPWYATWGNHDWVQRGYYANKFVVDGEATFHGFRIWFSPWSNTFMNWAWMQEPEALGALIYPKIPAGIDILVSHQPPFGYGDAPCFSLPRCGSHELLSTVLRVRPAFVICGHIHGGYGHHRLPHGDSQVTDVYNVSLVDDGYRLVNPPTLIEVE